jgi:tRNA-binding protein
MDIIQYNDFEKVELRVGTIIDAQIFPEARKPAYKLTIDFGSEIGIKKSSAQITEYYVLETLIWKQVIAVVNFAHKQIWPFISECLTIWLPDTQWHVVLISPDQKVPNWVKLF